MRSSLTWRHGKKCKIYLTIRTFKMNKSSQQSLRNLGMFSKNNCTQKQPSECNFQYCFSELAAKFFEKYLWRGSILVNLHVTLSCFWPLVQRSYILSHRSAKQLLLCGTPLESCFYLLKSRGKFLWKHPE